MAQYSPCCLRPRDQLGSPLPESPLRPSMKRGDPRRGTCPLRRSPLTARSCRQSHCARSWIGAKDVSINRCRWSNACAVALFPALGNNNELFRRRRRWILRMRRRNRDLRMLRKCDVQRRTRLRRGRVRARRLRGRSSELPLPPWRCVRWRSCVRWRIVWSWLAGSDVGCWPGYLG